MVVHQIVFIFLVDCGGIVRSKVILILFFSSRAAYLHRIWLFRVENSRKLQTYANPFAVPTSSCCFFFINNRRDCLQASTRQETVKGYQEQPQSLQEEHSSTFPNQPTHLYDLRPANNNYGWVSLNIFSLFKNLIKLAFFPCTVFSFSFLLFGEKIALTEGIIMQS